MFDDYGYDEDSDNTSWFLEGTKSKGLQTNGKVIAMTTSHWLPYIAMHLLVFAIWISFKNALRSVLDESFWDGSSWNTSQWAGSIKSSWQEVFISEI